MADSKLEIILSAKDQTKGAFSSVQSGLSGLGKASSSAGSALGTIAKASTVAAVAVGGALVAGIGGAVKSAMSFESAMSKVGAASQATGSEMKQLHGLALSLGSDLQLAGVDATDAALAMEELAKGGVSVADQMGGATKGALLLFSAGADSVAQATDVAVKSMNIFGLSGNDVAHVADLMAAGAGKSATSVGQLGAAFNQSAAVAKNAGLSIEELTGTLSFLAQRGMEGSDAGTSLKTALLALQAPTDVAAELMEDLGINVRDAQGEMLPFAQIAQVLQDKLSGLSAAQRDAALKTIFGNDAIRVGIALYEGGGKAITDWTAKVDDAGYAAKIGGQRNDNLAASFEQLKATITTGAIVIGEKFIPALRKATEAGTRFVTEFLANPAVQKGLDQLANDFTKGLDSIIKKLSDPTFQNQMKAWAKAAGDTAKAVIELAGAVKDTLGPPLQAAVGWFNDLDDAGKKNIVTFGLLAAAIAKFAGPLTTIAAAGAGAAKALAAMAAALPTAAIAATTAALGAGAAVTVAATAAWGAQVAAMVKYRDATGQTAVMQREFNTAMTASQFAQQQGATMMDGHVARFAQYIDATRTAVGTTDQMAAAWNAYLNTQTLAGQSTAGLTLATTALAQAQALSTTAHRDAQGALHQFNTAMVGSTTAAMALGATLPGVNQGFAAGASAASAILSPVQTLATVMQDTNGVLTISQERYGALSNSILTTTNEIAVMVGELGRLGTTFAQSQTQMKLLSTESGQLSGWLGVLQGEWDKLDAEVKQNGVTTDAQKQRYAELAPLIEYLNGRQGQLHATTVGLTEAQVKHWQTIQTLNSAIAEGGVKAGGATAALSALNWITGTSTKASDTHAKSVTGVSSAVEVATRNASMYTSTLMLVPKTVTTAIDTPGLSGAASGVDSYIGSLNSVPRNVTTTITTHYQTVGSPASASSIPALASGGIVTRPTLALIGERGPEAVVPLNGNFAPSGVGSGSGGRAQASGPVNHYTITVQGDVYDGQKFADKVVSTIENESRRGRL